MNDTVWQILLISKTSQTSSKHYFVSMNVNGTSKIYVSYHYSRYKNNNWVSFMFIFNKISFNGFVLFNKKLKKSYIMAR